MTDSARTYNWFLKAYIRAKKKSAKSLSVPFYATGDGVMVVKAEDILSSNAVMLQLKDIQQIESNYKIKRAKKAAKSLVHEASIQAEG